MAATRYPDNVDDRGGGSSSRHATALAVSGPAITARASSRSAALLASGPTTPVSTSDNAPGGGGRCPRIGMTPHVGLSPYTPQKWAGIRIEPPRSPPNSRPERAAATAAAAPPDEPPGVRPRSQGLLVVPNTSL